MHYSASPARWLRVFYTTRRAFTQYSCQVISGLAPWTTELVYSASSWGHTRVTKFQGWKMTQSVSYPYNFDSRISYIFVRLHSRPDPRRIPAHSLVFHANKSHGLLKLHDLPICLRSNCFVSFSNSHYPGFPFAIINLQSLFQGESAAFCSTKRSLEGKKCHGYLLSAG